MTGEDDPRAKEKAANRGQFAWVADIIDDYRKEFGADTKVTAVFSPSGEQLLGKPVLEPALDPPSPAELEQCALRGWCLTRAYCQRHGACRASGSPGAGG